MKKFSPLVSYNTNFTSQNIKKKSSWLEIVNMYYLIFAIYFSDCFKQRGHPAIHKQSDIFRAQKHWE